MQMAQSIWPPTACNKRPGGQIHGQDLPARLQDLPAAADGRLCILGASPALLVAPASSLSLPHGVLLLLLLPASAAVHAASAQLLPAALSTAAGLCQPAAAAFHQHTQCTIVP